MDKYDIECVATFDISIVQLSLKWRKPSWGYERIGIERITLGFTGFLAPPKDDGA